LSKICDNYNYRPGSVDYIYIIVFKIPATAEQTPGVDVTSLSVKTVLQDAIATGRITEISSDIVIDPSTKVIIQGTCK
jgi:hypothetical protein